jgi:hypothetical protein
MELSEEDIAKLAALGFHEHEFAELHADGVVRLRNVGGSCFFLGAENKGCQVYEHRPLGCRIYPVNLTLDDVLVVDDLCPQASTITRAEMNRKGRQLRPHLQSIDAEARVRRSKQAKG